MVRGLAALSPRTVPWSSGLMLRDFCVLPCPPRLCPGNDPLRNSSLLAGLTSCTSSAYTAVESHQTLQFWPDTPVDIRSHPVPAGFQNLNPVHSYHVSSMLITSLLLMVNISSCLLLCVSYTSFSVASLTWCTYYLRQEGPVLS